MTQTINDCLIEIEMEGFDYALRNSADWSDIDDPEFQGLYQKYLEAANELENYLMQFELEDEDE